MYVFSSVLHVIFVAGTLSVFCVFPKLSSTPGDSPCGNGKRPVKRGKGHIVIGQGHAMPHRFRVCMVWGLALWSGSFRFANKLTTDQRYSMSDNAHRVAFMAHYNGDGGRDGWISCLC